MRNNNNYCVIMSGGVGSRFWPFSKEERPKQFLDFFGTGRSLLQTTFDRFEKLIPKENIYVVTNDSYGEITKKQLPELSESQILLEPLRRNTAPAIAYASFHIYAKNPDANIIVAPSDHLILKEDIFLQEIERGLEFVENNSCLLTLGITPSRPETGYGYIQESGEEDIDGIKKVKTFTEKPNIDLAKVFFESGEFVWNSGIFLWNVQTIINAFKDHLPEIHTKMLEGKDKFNTPQEKEFIDAAFPFCANISIDYGVLEKADNVYVIGSDFGWSDLGTWGALYEVSEKDDDDNVSFNSKSLFFDSNDNVVAMNDNKLVVIQGLKGYIVAESDNSLLICKKDEEQRIKHFVNDVKFRYGDDFV